MGLQLLKFGQNLTIFFTHSLYLECFQSVVSHDGAAAILRGNRFHISSPLQEDREKLALRDKCYSEFERGHLDTVLQGDPTCVTPLLVRISRTGGLKY